MAEAISWGALPNIPRVMVEFTGGRQDVLSLLGGDWRHPAARATARDRRNKWTTPIGLGDALRSGYDGLRLTTPVEANLAALDLPDTLAIVTGQQIGIFGGPLFTFYKALHTVLLAQQLRTEAPGAVVPVFWMETADADFGEVNRIAFPPNDGEPRRAVYTPHDVVAGRSISLHNLSPEIEGVRSQIAAWLDELRSGRPLAELIERAYRPGRPMGDAFRELFHDFFGEMGLILADACHPALVAKARGFWSRVLSRPGQVNDPFVIASRELEQARLPLQVSLRRDALPVLQIGGDGVRRRILGRPGEWRMGSDGELMDDAALARLVADQPDSLTPSALLRPLLQDWLLPTWIYVGGPAEVAYHAQIGRAYDAFCIPRPLIAPRLSLTLVERLSRRSLDKHKWTIADVIGGREILLRRSGKAEALAGLFDGGSEHFRSWLKRIERAGDEAAINLYDEIDQAGRKIEHQWNRLKRVALYKLGEQDSSAVLHAERLQGRLLPDGMLQERHTSVLYFLAAYGRGIINTIADEVDLFTAQHLALDVETGE